MVPQLCLRNTENKLFCKMTIDSGYFNLISCNLDDGAMGFNYTRSGSFDILEHVEKQLSRVDDLFTTFMKPTIQAKSY